MQRAGWAVVVAVVAGASTAAPTVPLPLPLPEPTSSRYCIAVQQFLADTTVVGENTVFDSMAAYRHSKPTVPPLRIFQVVTYAGQLPIVVSCKVKTAAHLRAAYGARAAGRQRACWQVAQWTRDTAVAQLQRDGNPAAATRAAALVIDRNAPYVTGRAYLGDFQSIYRGTDGAAHLNSPGLFQDYDSWITALLPRAVQGQSYCHLATVAYVKAVATERMKPGATITTHDDAPVRPR